MTAITEFNRTLLQKADRYELDEVRRNVVALERTVGKLSSTSDGLRARLEELLSRIYRLEQNEP